MNRPEEYQGIGLAASMNGVPGQWFADEHQAKQKRTRQVELASREAGVSQAKIPQD